MCRSALRGVTLPVCRGGREVTLFDLLRTLDIDKVRASRWLGKHLDCAGTPGAARELNQASDAERSVAGERLLELARSGVQVIDGELRAQETGAGAPWVILRAVDSTSWDIESPDAELLRVITRTFPGAAALAV